MRNRAITVSISLIALFVLLAPVSVVVSESSQTTITHDIVTYQLYNTTYTLVSEQDNTYIYAIDSLSNASIIIKVHYQSYEIKGEWINTTTLLIHIGVWVGNDLYEIQRVEITNVVAGIDNNIVRLKEGKGLLEITIVRTKNDIENIKLLKFILLIVLVFLFGATGLAAWAATEAAGYREF